MQTRTNIVAAGLLLVAASSQASMTQYHATYANPRQVDGAVMTFGLEHGRYPSQSEGLSLLVTGPPEKPETNSYAYIKVVPKDAWGRDFVYRFPSLHNTNGPDIYPLGEDGISKTGGNDADDINNWNRHSLGLLTTTLHRYSAVLSPGRLAAQLSACSGSCFGLVETDSSQAGKRQG